MINPAVTRFENRSRLEKPLINFPLLIFFDRMLRCLGLR
jgi:hypothetical protein